MSGEYGNCNEHTLECIFSQSQWHNSNDLSPQDKEMVLVFDYQEKCSYIPYFICQYHKEFDCYTLADLPDIQLPITIKYWMSLPCPPQEN